MQKRYPSIFIFFLSFLFCCNTLFAQDYTSENLFYLGGSPDSYESFMQHADQISIVCPAAYEIDSVGVISGNVDQRVLETAQQKGVKVMPLFASFNQRGIHDLLNNPAARKEAIRLMRTFRPRHT